MRSTEEGEKKRRDWVARVAHEGVGGAEMWKEKEESKSQKGRGEGNMRKQVMCVCVRGGER